MGPYSIHHYIHYTSNYPIQSNHGPGQHKLWGFLGTSLHLELFSLRAYFKVLRQKVPYFNVSRRKVPYFNICDVFNWFGTLYLSLSLYLSLYLSISLSISLSMSLSMSPC